MKFALALLTTLGSLAHAQVDDDDLVRALQNLNSRGLYVDTSTRAMVQERAGRVVMVAAVVGATMAAANSRLFAGWRKVTTWTELYIADGALIVMLGGGLAWLGAEAAKRFERAPMPLPASQYVNSAEAMNEFFRLPIEMQLSIAKPDETFRKFLISLSQAYDVIDKRIPDEPVPGDAGGGEPKFTPAAE